MIRAPELDWNAIEAARANAHYLRSEAAYNIAAAIGERVRRLFGRGSATAPAANGSFVSRCLDFARAKSPLEKGLQAGWY